MLRNRIKWGCCKLIRMALTHLRSCEWGDIEVGFIISTGRTGTEFIANFFRENFRGVDARHEPAPDMFDLGTNYLRSKIPFPEAVTQFRYDRQNICHAVHKGRYNHYIECNNNLAYLVPIIQELYTNYKFVYITRDGRDFVRSVYSRTTLKNGRAVLVMTDDDPRTRLAATDFQNDPYCSKWADMSRIERISWYWVKVNQTILDSLANEKNSITVKFEDIFDKERGYEGMWKIIEFFRLREKVCISQEDFEKKMVRRVNRNREYTLPHCKDWSDKQKAQFAEIAGELMARFGYNISGG